MTGICDRCGGVGETHQHHTSYKENKTVPLCPTCHGEVHQDPSSEYYPDDINDEIGGRSEIVIFPSGSYKLRSVLSENSQINIPGIVRRALDLEPGDQLDVDVKRLDRGADAE